MFLVTACSEKLLIMVKTKGKRSKGIETFLFFNVEKLDFPFVLYDQNQEP